jgi:hypothetical protein
MNTKVIIRILLGVAVIFMAYICVNSVVTPIQFEDARLQREVKVINNLVSLRTAEAQFRLDKGYFTADLDSLVDYLKTTPKKEVYKVGSLSEKQLEENVDEYAVIEDGRLDLDELVREELLLSFPMRTLCSPDCEGLCPKCGRPRRLGDCGCQTREIDPRLAVLRTLLED